MTEKHTEHADTKHEIFFAFLQETMRSLEKDYGLKLTAIEGVGLRKIKAKNI